MMTVKSDGLQGKIERAGFVPWLTILLALAFLPTLAMAAPPLSPDETTLARQGPTVRIDPAESVVGASQTFTISVMIEEADDLGAFEFTLLFITTTVTVDSVILGDFPGSTGRTVIPADLIIVDNQVGKASFGVVTVPPGMPGPSGTGVLATITLTAQGPGESSLDLKDVVVLDTYAERKTPIVEDGVVRAGFAIYLPLVLKE